MAQVVETPCGNPRRRRRARRIACAALAAATVATLVTFRNPWFNGNFGVVAPQRVYRSAQPEDELPALIARYHLASVLNLRGGAPDDGWYQSEIAATRESGIDFYDLPMSATRRPLRRELLILLDLFDRCPYPLLIHCKSGSDRTGLAAALYLMSQKGEGPEQALRAFSLQYGHVPLFGPEHLHEPLQEYAAWLKASGLAHTPARLRFWVAELYAANDERGEVPRLLPGPRRAIARELSATPP